MKVKIIRATIAQRKQVFPGEVLEVEKAEAVILIGAGKAVAMRDNAPEQAIIPPAEVAAKETAMKPTAIRKRRP